MAFDPFVEWDRLRWVKWDSVTWDGFERALTECRAAEYAGARGKPARPPTCACSKRSNPFRSASAGSALTRSFTPERLGLPLPHPHTNIRNAFRDWISRESSALERLSTLALTGSELLQQDECERLHGSLLALQSAGDGPSISTMGPAAASKILRVMVPRLFVMWDTKIKKRGLSYAEFLGRMHHPAREIIDDLAPANARADIESYLQRTLAHKHKDARTQSGSICPGERSADDGCLFY